MNRLPSLNALRAFEAAGRHQSLTRAAEELHVTPAAVGHQVRALEEYLGVSLFRKVSRNLTLTEAGRALLPGLRQGFDVLVQTLEAFRERDRKRPLTVSTSPSFAGKWLVPRLERFRRAYPGLEIRIDASARLVDFASEEIDIGVRYGPGGYDDLHVVRLLTEQAFPVCSPALIAGDKPLLRPEDLRHHTLLHIEHAFESSLWSDWPTWLASAGVEGVEADRGPSFSISELAIQAAIEGQGVALAGSVLVERDLAAHRLVKPFDLSVSGNFAYYVVCARAKASHPNVVAFRGWLLDEACGSSRS